MTVPSRTDLRPLGAGELLDRAVTLYARNFRGLVAVLAAAYVPLGIIQLVVLEPIFEHMARAGGHPPKPGSPVSFDTLFGAGGLMRFTLGMLVVFVVFSLVRTAAVTYVNAAYAGEQRSLRFVFERGFARLASQMLTGFLAALLMFAVYFAGAIAISIAVVVVGLLTGGLGPQQMSVPAIVVAVVLFASLLLPMAWIYMAWQLATVETSQGKRAPQSLGYGLSIAFGRFRWRALLGGLVLAALFIGVEMIAMVAGGLLAAVTRFAPLNVALSTVIGTLYEGVVVSFVVVFALDVKVRREGLDIALAADPETLLPA